MSARAPFVARLLSFLSKGALHLVCEGFQQVRNHATFFRHEKGLYRHAGKPLACRAPRKFIFGYVDARDVVALAGLFVGLDVGGDAAQAAVDLGRAP
jgi:hypothetical protein